MSCESMQENLVRRLAGDLPENETRELDRHLESCESCRAEAAAMSDLWTGLGELPDEAPSPALRQRFETMLGAAVAAERRATPIPFPTRRTAEPSRHSGVRRWLPMAAVLAFGFGLGWLFWGRGKSEVTALRQEVGQLHQLVAESLLEKSSVSDRLQGVAYGREYSAADPGVAAALVRALENDANVNVRLAALEALRPVAARPAHRSQLVAVAARPDSPLVSLSVIEVLLDSGTPEARRDLEQLLDDPNLEPVVRGYLRDRLGRSI
jgi:anti-sigma factor RsiW